MVEDVKRNEAPLTEAVKDCSKHESKGVARLRLQDKVNLGERRKSMIFEVMELVMTLCKLATSP